MTQQRFEKSPGEQAQRVWGQVTVSLGGERVRLHNIVMTFGYSRRASAEAFLDERMDSLPAARERAFAHFGGCCRFLLYDRMRTVVAGTLDGRPRFTSRLASLADHWGFTIRLCRPCRAQTKGKVECGVKYVKRSFVPGRTFRDLDDVNARPARWQHDVADRRTHGATHQRPIERFTEEARRLIPSGGHPSFLVAMVRDRVVAEDWLLSIDTNRYSVPSALIGRTVPVTRVGGSWVIRHRSVIVAGHSVLAGGAQVSVRPRHGPGAATRNVRQRCDTSVTPTPEPSAPDIEGRDLDVHDALVEVSPGQRSLTFGRPAPEGREVLFGEVIQDGLFRAMVLMAHRSGVRCWIEQVGCACLLGGTGLHRPTEGVPRGPATVAADASVRA